MGLGGNKTIVCDVQSQPPRLEWNPVGLWVAARLLRLRDRGRRLLPPIHPAVPLGANTKTNIRDPIGGHECEGPTASSDVRFQGAGSTGRRNTGVKSLCWGFKLQVSRGRSLS